MLIDAVDGAMDLIDQRCCKKWAVVSGDLFFIVRFHKIGEWKIATGTQHGALAEKTCVSEVYVGIVLKW